MMQLSLGLEMVGWYLKRIQAHVAQKAAQTAEPLTQVIPHAEIAIDATDFTAAAQARSSNRALRRIAFPRQAA